MEPSLFLTFFNGIYCDFDGADGDQCFDLANAFSRWIGGQPFTGASANVIYGQTQNGFYQAIPYMQGLFPQAYDIVVWNWPHVGIATGNNTNSEQLEVLEQNDPENSNCHIKVYQSYAGVIGFLRPTQLPQSQQSIIDTLRIARDTNWNLYQTELAKNNTLTQTNEDLQKEVADTKSALAQQANITQQQATSDTTTIDGLLGQLEGAKILATDIQVVAAELSTTYPPVKNMTQAIALLKQTNNALTSQVQTQATTAQNFLTMFINKYIKWKK